MVEDLYARCFSFTEQVVEGIPVCCDDGAIRVASHATLQPALLKDEMTQFISSLPPDDRQLLVVRTNVSKSADGKHVWLGKPTPDGGARALLYISTPSGVDGEIAWHSRYDRLMSLNKKDRVYSRTLKAWFLEVWLVLYPGAQVIIQRTGELEAGDARQFRLRWDGQALYTERSFAQVRISRSVRT